MDEDAPASILAAPPVAAHTETSSLRHSKQHYSTGNGVQSSAALIYLAFILLYTEQSVLLWELSHTHQTQNYLMWSAPYLPAAPRRLTHLERNSASKNNGYTKQQTFAHSGDVVCVICKRKSLLQTLNSVKKQFGVSV